MKKILMITLATMMMATPVLADLPDTYTSTDPDELYAIDIDSLTEDELRTAYSALRGTYAACFQALIDEHTKGLTGGEDSDPEPTPIPLSDSIWTIKYYVDEFQQPTDEAYVTNAKFIQGTFSNSATTNSLLKVIIIVDNTDVGIRLLEYGNNIVKGYYDNGHAFDISILIDGEKKEMGGKLFDGGDRVIINNLDESSFRHALATGHEIKMYLKNTTDNSTYLFTIPATMGFKDLYESLFDFY